MKFPGGTGDIGFTAPKRQEKVQKRLTRADKLGTPDPFDPDYDKKVKKVDGRSKIGKVFKSTKPVKTSAPGFGKGDTPGETRVKGLEKKAFKKTQPSDVKLPQTFKDFSTKLRRLKSDIQDVKDKDIATMRTGKSSSKLKVSGGKNLSRQDVGMAPPDKPKVVKQSEVSKKAKAFTNEIAQQKKAKTDKVVDLATKKQQSKLSQTAKDLEKQTGKIDAAKQKLRSATGTKDVKKIRQLNVQGREYRKLTQATKKAASGVGNPNAPVVYNKMTAGADFIKKNRVKPKTNTGLKNPPGMIDRRRYKGPVKANTTKVELPKFTGVTAKGNPSIAREPFVKGPQLAKLVKNEPVKALRQPQNLRYLKAASKQKGLAKGIIRGLGRLGPKGRLAAAGATAFFATPMGRNFAKNLAIGGGLTAALGLANKKEKVLKKGDGLKTVGKVNVRYGLTGTSKKGQGGKVYDPKQMAQLGKVQKNFIDKYNKKAARNPFKKQIQYKPKADGTYKILDPKKK